jgi:hypothetical protein
LSTTGELFEWKRGAAESNDRLRRRGEGNKKRERERLKEREGEREIG